jgi:hypothetical protein
MQLKDYFPIWNQLTEAQQKQITQRAVLRKAEKGTIVHKFRQNHTNGGAP